MVLWWNPLVHSRSKINCRINCRINSVILFKTHMHEWSMIILMDKLEPVNCRCHAWAETAAASASWTRKCRRCSQMHLEKKETQHVTWNILFLFYFRNILVTICYHYKPVFGMYFDHRQIFLALKNNYSRWKVFLKILYFLVVKITM